MPNVEIVIKIDDKLYNRIKYLESKTTSTLDGLMRSVRSGVILPEGHGDLIDVNRKITVPIYDEQYEEWGEKILTVREALNRWSDEGITAKDVILPADKTNDETRNQDLDFEELKEDIERE